MINNNELIDQIKSYNKFLISKLDQKSRIEITRLNKNVIIKS